VPHPVLSPGRVAVVTGAAMGIGLAAAKRFAGLGMKVCLADNDAAALAESAAAVAALAPGGDADVHAVPTDVSRAADIVALKAAVDARFGGCALLMNNAASRATTGTWGDLGQWAESLDTNLWASIRAVAAFVPDMLASGEAGMVVNTGSKQGITTPPRNIPYNVSKAALKVYTESLQHELRNVPGARVSAHLLVPGWTTRGGVPHKPGAWRPEQVVDTLILALERGDFYIICLDDETTAEMDRKRILWAAGDIVENRPALSRWHPEWGAAYEAFAANDD
jgi:NAD(P)-dependent dehydrogenase (short-subunit alcohol dehydrogenase family)